MNEHPELPDPNANKPVDLTAFNLNDLVKAGHPDDVHVVASGRPYTTVAQIGDSRLLMAAGLEPVAVPVKNLEGKKWAALAVVVRFIVKGPTDAFQQLKTRTIDPDYEHKGITYKDKLEVPFCISGNPIWALRMYKEKGVEDIVLDNLIQRVPMADKAILQGLLDAMFAGVTEDDPIVVEVIG